ncbi:MAG: hypothetical protein HC804_14105, partial [Anaerolineae bacterium]|nr:hypothetical protein [Anaerolineae bacterium]
MSPTLNSTPTEPPSQATVTVRTAVTATPHAINTPSLPTPTLVLPTRTEPTSIAPTSALPTVTSAVLPATA